MFLLLELLKASFIGSAVWIALLCLRPTTGRLFSQTWHYYASLISLAFLLGAASLAPPAAFLGKGLLSKLGAPESEASAIEPSSKDMSSQSPFLQGGANRPAQIKGWEEAENEGVGPGAKAFFLADIKASFLSEMSAMLLLSANINAMLPFLAAAWLAGAAGFFAVRLAAYAKLRRILLRGSWSLSAANPARIVASPMAASPMILGVMRPVIILPAQAYSEAALEMALAHELVHFSRRDTLVKLLLLLARAIHWFNPLVHLMAGDIDELCESSCDERVVSKMGKAERRLYGELILSTLERGAAGRVPLGAGMSPAGKSVKRRLMKMISYKKSKRHVVALSIALAIMLGASGIALAYTFPEAPELAITTSQALQVEKAPDEADEGSEAEHQAVAEESGATELAANEDKADEDKADEDKIDITEKTDIDEAQGSENKALNNRFEEVADKAGAIDAELQVAGNELIEAEHQAVAEESGATEQGSENKAANNSSDDDGLVKPESAAAEKAPNPIGEATPQSVEDGTGDAIQSPYELAYTLEDVREILRRNDGTIPVTNVMVPEIVSGEAKGVIITELDLNQAMENLLYGFKKGSVMKHLVAPSINFAEHNSRPMESYEVFGVYYNEQDGIWMYDGKPIGVLVDFLRNVYVNLPLDPEGNIIVEKMSKDDYAIISILYEKVDIMKCVIDLSVKGALNLIDYSLGYEIDMYGPSAPMIQQAYAERNALIK
ncbi:MAG: hypothetical protein LBT59_19810 [Clostridiales bacterium]|nr:hypothetical protein [Clostridiales bacterium]